MIRVAYFLLLPFVAVVLHGCDDGGSGPVGPSPGHTNTTQTTTLVPQINIWQWRADMVMGTQITYDLSGDTKEHCLYGGCWRRQGVDTLVGGPWTQYQPADEQFKDGGKTFGKYVGDSGVSLYNMQNSSKPGCIMRKSRLPIDLSEIGRLEMDVTASGTTGKAPWYAVWLAPMIYGPKDDNAKSAEIDLIENYDQQGRGGDVNNVNTNFAQCGQIDYTRPYCQPSGWGPVATQINHHITMKMRNDPVDGRMFDILRCSNAESKQTTCTQGEGGTATIKVQKAAPAGAPREDWFPVWNKDVAKDHYAKYWLVADVWWTSGTDFKLTVDDVSFFKDDGTEWQMPLDGPPPTLSRGVQETIV